jgi:hypothetical protein
VCLVLNKIAEGVFFIGSTFKKKKKKELKDIQKIYLFKL